MMGTARRPFMVFAMVPAAVSKQRRRALFALVMIGAAMCRPAHAETTKNFNVAARVTAGCLVDGLGVAGDAGDIGTLDFGTDSTFSTAVHNASLNAAQTIRLRCTPGVNVTMAIDGGQHSASGGRNLQLAPGQTIAYALCGDAACTQPIAINATTVIAVTPSNSADIRLPVFGRLTLPGNLPPGTYRDELMVTLTW
jgi:spore coat protein U-like protein